MNIQRFKDLNNIIGWLIFFIASAVYALTMEASSSLWDCGEFVASAYKQLVVHPPGAPLFLMITRMFTLLAGGNTALVALSVNFMSALCSGAAMMFLFWIITHLGRRLLIQPSDTELPMDKAIAILGAGIVGALSGTFTDSIWFSAVEGEVYSMSLFWTALVFWSIIKWDEHADEPYADRWLLFTSFMIGCSIFVHWLNLLTIPAMALVYYFRRNEKATPKGAGIAFLVGILILGFIMKIVITGIVDVAASTEMFFVNQMGMPFNSGAIVFFLVFISLFVFALYYTYKHGKITAHNGLLALMFILIGYSTIATSVIRSNSQPSIDMNSPSDLVSLSAYLKREQYGSRPFLTGYDYTAKIVGTEKLSDKYARGKDKYDDVGDRIDYVYQGKSMLFPRIYSQEPGHRALYEMWLGLKPGEKPSTLDNYRFLFNYQLGHMYFRYLFWNFVGKQNDDQATSPQRRDGNWLSGIPFIDSIRLGSQAEITDAAKDIPSRNTYFFIPFLLGLLGLVYQYTNNKRWFVIVFLLFFFTGMAILIQGNSPPIEPRERDYIFAGSFWAFCIWIGLGVIALYDIILGKKQNSTTAAYLATGMGLIVPLLMGWQGWDDHNRSDRFAARDFAANYLNSCAPNAILFTQGDNDTYPLWYAQEVEGIRRDVRVVNLSLLGVDWYINQIERKVNDAAPVPMTLKGDKIRGTTRDIVPYMANPDIAPADAYVSLQNLMQFVGDDSPRSKVEAGNEQINYLPTKNVKLALNAASFNTQNALSPEYADHISPELQWTINKNNLYKNDVMVLDIIAANNWERPIYFAVSVSPDSYLGLEKYFQLEGLAYRVVPIETANSAGVYKGIVNPDIMYDNLMNKFKYGNLSQQGVWVDTDLRRMVSNFRQNFSRLAEALLARGDKKRAAEVLQRMEEVFPDSQIPYDMFMYTVVGNYYDTGDYEKANAFTEKLANRIVQELRYFNSMPISEKKYNERERVAMEQLLKVFVVTAKEKNQTDFANKLQGMIDKI